jgi:hypothetical protein
MKVNTDSVVLICDRLRALENNRPYTSDTDLSPRTALYTKEKKKYIGEVCAWNPTIERESSNHEAASYLTVLPLKAYENTTHLIHKD